MGFDASPVTDISYRLAGASMRISWATTAAGMPHQIYVGDRLQWGGLGTSATIPRPPTSARITIGAVGAGEASTDFSASLPARPRNRARLTWSGGVSLGEDLAGFRVYGEETPGGGIDYETPLADISAYASGDTPRPGDADGVYEWESRPYPAGEWEFAVVPYDVLGNEGDPLTTTVELVSPPQPVPMYDERRRLRRTYDFAAKTVQIRWQASEG